MLDISVNVDEEGFKDLLLEKVEERLKQVDFDLVFWDRKELIRRTCLSWNTIQEYFFHDPRFPKFKVGSKWIFPATETREFLLTWLREQNKY
ncbi:MAG: group-specific protein [Bacillota bacterium]|nr:group-specific protein [Bacillota bacterium]